jgi:hypothetical protein
LGAILSYLKIKNTIMKKITRILMLFLAVSLFAASKNYAQIVVRARLSAHAHIVRPVRPSPRHVWVSEEWVPSGGTYIHRAGYWALPPHRGAIWIAGHWRRHHRGWIWISGYWNR